jgi:hypothetical protein
MYTHLAKGFATSAVDDAMRVNRRRLNSCMQHFFKGPLKRNGVAAELLQCMVCEGFLPLETAAEYARGFAAAGGDPETVIQGFGR